MPFRDLPEHIRAEYEFLYGGMAVNVGGVTFALWSAYRRGEDRGDW